MYSTQTAINLLVIDPSVNEAERHISTLRNADLVIHPVIINSEMSLREAKNDPAPDMILCSAEGTPARLQTIMDLCFKYYPDSPAIILYRDQDPEVLLRAMQDGARDVVSVEDPEHLELVVKREFGDLQNRSRLLKLTEQLRQAEARYTSIIDHSNDAIAYIHDGMHVLANPAYLQKFGYTGMNEIEGQPILDLIAPQDLTRIKRLLRSGKVKDSQLEVTCQTSSGNSFPANLEFSTTTLDGEPCTQIVIKSSLPAEERVHRLSVFGSRSSDTGLPNKHHFLLQLDSRFAETRKKKSRNALLYVLIPNFHQIRSVIGIPSSELLAKEFARVLKKNSGEQDFLAQYGDDAFVILSEGSEEQLTEFAEHLLQAIKDHLFPIDGEFSPPLCSIGIACQDRSVSNSRDLINRGFLAAEMGSQLGEFRFSVYDHQQTDIRLETEESDPEINSVIQHALDNDGFKLLYQPVVSLQGDSRETYAVLVRMINKRGIEILPDEFMDAAVGGGQMLDIDRWIIKHAIMELANQRKRGHKVSFFVSLSGIALQSEDLMVWICDCLRSYKVRGAWLTFQLKERDLRIHTQKAKTFIEHLNKIKCQISVDQYGTVSDPETLLKNLPIDYVKFDSSLITNLSKHQDKQIKLSNLNQQAKINNVKTIATGVEDASSLALLWTTGVNYIQGYFLQEPSERITYDFSAV
jgi:diguanylate cyclase (GGDEF)-like protein/PAS domain S-box-containing protein